MNPEHFEFEIEAVIPPNVASLISMPESAVKGLGDLLKYLSKCGGQDTMRFWAEGKPDIDAAREYADKIRATLDGSNLVEVTQRVNAVYLVNAA